MSQAKFEDIQVCVFDAYGTLFDVHSAVGRHKDRLGADADRISDTWRRICPGAAKASCTFQRGQAPPKRAKCSRLALKRLEMLPALSTRIMKNGTPFEPGRCRVVSRWQTCSKLASKRACSTESNTPTEVS